MNDRSEEILECEDLCILVSQTYREMKRKEGIYDSAERRYKIAVSDYRSARPITYYDSNGSIQYDYTPIQRAEAEMGAAYGIMMSTRGDFEQSKSKYQDAAEQVKKSADFLVDYKKKTTRNLSIANRIKNGHYGSSMSNVSYRMTQEINKIDQLLNEVNKLPISYCFPKDTPDYYLPPELLWQEDNKKPNPPARRPEKIKNAENNVVEASYPDEFNKTLKKLKLYTNRKKSSKPSSEIEFLVSHNRPLTFTQKKAISEFENIMKARVKLEYKVGSSSFDNNNSFDIKKIRVDNHEIQWDPSDSFFENGELKIERLTEYLDQFCILSNEEDYYGKLSIYKKCLLMENPRIIDNLSITECEAIYKSSKSKVERSQLIKQISKMSNQKMNRWFRKIYANPLPVDDFLQKQKQMNLEIHQLIENHRLQREEIPPEPGLFNPDHIICQSLCNSKNVEEDHQAVNPQFVANVNFYLKYLYSIAFCSYEQALSQIMSKGSDYEKCINMYYKNSEQYGTLYKNVLVIERDNVPSSLKYLWQSYYDYRQLSDLYDFSMPFGTFSVPVMINAEYRII